MKNALSTSNYKIKHMVPLFEKKTNVNFKQNRYNKLGLCQMFSGGCLCRKILISLGVVRSLP